MATYRVLLEASGPLNAHDWEFKHGAYPKPSKNGVIVEIDVEADSQAAAKKKAEIAIEAKYSTLKGKVIALKAWLPTTSVKYVKDKPTS